MDRRDFLRLMASSGALATLGPHCKLEERYQPPGRDSSQPDGGPAGDGPPTEAGPPPDPRIEYALRPRETHLTPYLVIPKLDVYQPDDPVWNSWAGVSWPELPHPPHGFWFNVPEVGQSEDVVVPVINLGNLTTRHLVIELYEGPHARELSLSQCELRDRRGPFVLHPGQITGYRLRFTRQREEGASVAICYDPFFDPIHAIAAVGAGAPDRKNLGNCDGIQPPLYPGSYGG